LILKPVENIHTPPLELPSFRPMSKPGVCMTPISSIGNVSTAYAHQAQQSATQPKPQQSEPTKDTVQLSKAALAALKGGDVDHDGDSH